jgi:hypothetical protein
MSCTIEIVSSCTHPIQMHLVLITSVLRPCRDHTIFSTQDRLQQTLNSIASVRTHIPDSYIVLLEGGVILPEEAAQLRDTTDQLWCTDISHLPKSPGEGTLLYRYLTSPEFTALPPFLTLSKLSGRYYLNANFCWEALPLTKSIIIYREREWLGFPVYLTRYYRVAYHRVSTLITGLANYLQSPEYAQAWPDMEHCSYRFGLIEVSEIFTPPRLGVSGYITGSGAIIDE